VVTRNTYTPAGRLQSSTPDLSGFVPGTDDPLYLPLAAGAATFTYTPLGDVATAINPSATVTRRYDSLRRMVLESVDGVTIELGYDDASRRTQLVYPDKRVL